MQDRENEVVIYPDYDNRIITINTDEKKPNLCSGRNSEELTPTTEDFYKRIKILFNKKLGEGHDYSSVIIERLKSFQFSIELLMDPADLIEISIDRPMSDLDKSVASTESNTIINLFQELNKFKDIIRREKENNLLTNSDYWKEIDEELKAINNLLNNYNPKNKKNSKALEKIKYVFFALLGAIAYYFIAISIGITTIAGISIMTLSGGAIGIGAYELYKYCAKPKTSRYKLFRTPSNSKVETTYSTGKGFIEAMEKAMLPSKPTLPTP